MGGRTTFHGHKQQELVRQQEETERRKQQEREAHKRNVEAAYQIIEIFNRNTSVFKKNGIVYCLDKERPPFAPTICLFRRYESRKPAMIFVPVIVGGPHGTFSLRSLIKRKKRETFSWTTDHIQYYEERHTRLSDDPQEAASEIITKLIKQNVEFNSLWQFDRTMGMCARRYFARRRAALGLGCAAVIAIAAMLLFSIAQRGW